MQSALYYISKSSTIDQRQIEATLKLLNEDATIPFIARYRKEATGNLDEVEIEQIKKLNQQFLELEKRKEYILKVIDEQGKLSADLKKSIQACLDLTSLEDLYLPYKSKRETKADKARKLGLEPLAKIIMAQNNTDINGAASQFITKEVKSIDDALAGARLIMAEWMNERIGLRDQLRNMMERKGKVKSTLVKGKEIEAEKFKDYFKWEEDLYRIPAHRFLAINRGETFGFLKFKISLPTAEVESKIANYFIRGNNFAANAQIELAAKDAWKRLLHPVLENEFKKLHKLKADETSIKVFGENLKQLLLSAPLGEKRVMAIDPGFRTGCKVVCLDETGKLLYNETIFPHPPKNESKQAMKKISTLVSAYKIEAIAIGDGTAGRETEAFIQRIHFDRKLFSYMVNENGASIYSASAIAREEFPDYDITVRGAVSIGRRLMDPLAELVKIDAKSIGVGQYQHDVDQKLLKESLDRVVEYSVNQVGVNLNTASKHLLQYVSGLGETLAERIVDYRTQNNGIESIAHLKEVKGLGAKAFQQSAGFLRVSKSDFSLDQTGIHPEIYKEIVNILKANHITLKDVKSKKEKIEVIDFDQYTSSKLGSLTLKDAKEELLNAGADLRKKKKTFTFDDTVKSIDDLRKDMVLPGLVSNITNFGAFVNIGIKQDGLVHVSNMANEFVKDPNEYVHLGMELSVKVIEVDKERSRIQLSMKD
ncbi:MAG: Tex family protein [Vicingaceae bacterium]